ncbi:hypothetical protein ACFE04_025356 [Oxalis oulophora]
MDYYSSSSSQSFNSRYSNYALEALNQLPDCFTITDPTISGHPIVYASLPFLKLSGYSIHQVIGNNGRIFQGPLTDRRAIISIRNAIREVKPIQLCLLNYRKDGTPFWMLFHMSPLFSKDDGTVIHFVAVQVPISRKTSSSCSNGYDDAMFGSCRKELSLDSSMMNRLLRSHSDNKVLLLDSQIKESIRAEQAFTVRILSYRKDRSSFWNLLHISPVRNASGKIAYFIGVQLEEGCKNEGQPGLSSEKRHLSVVGAVKVAVRGLSLGAGSSKS